VVAKYLAAAKKTMDAEAAAAFEQNVRSAGCDDQMARIAITPHWVRWASLIVILSFHPCSTRLPGTRTSPPDRHHGRVPNAATGTQVWLLTRDANPFSVFSRV
jgi:hypothetical protein